MNQRSTTRLLRRASVYIDNLVLVILLVASFVLGAVLVWLYLRRQLQADVAATAALQDKLTAKTQEAQACASRVATLEGSNRELTTKLAERQQPGAGAQALARDRAAQGLGGGDPAGEGSDRAPSADRDVQVGSAVQVGGADAARPVGDVGGAAADGGSVPSTAADGGSVPSTAPDGGSVPVSQGPDDLTIIEGIGPKISQLLTEAGIPTFAALASTSTDRLRQILDDAHLRVADPSTWAEQAGLAAAGDWGGLESLQGQLKGGRRR